MPMQTPSPAARAELPPCPRCGAARGEPCRALNDWPVGPGKGEPMQAIHAKRDEVMQRELAKRARSGLRK
jgi:hypothetical protein